MELENESICAQFERFLVLRDLLENVGDVNELIKEYEDKAAKHELLYNS